MESLKEKISNLNCQIDKLPDQITSDIQTEQEKSFALLYERIDKSIDDSREVIENSIKNALLNLNLDPKQERRIVTAIANTMKYSMTTMAKHQKDMMTEESNKIIKEIAKTVKANLKPVTGNIDTLLTQVESLPAKINLRDPSGHD